jgi:para-aminobenzoate synthetase/4-amino-4-deoxychorismate lyase
MHAIVQQAQNQWLFFESPVSILAARTLKEVQGVLEEACATAENRHVVGFLAYEAAPALDSACVTHDPVPGMPLAWFAVFESPEVLDALPNLHKEGLAHSPHPPLRSPSFAGQAEPLPSGERDAILKDWTASVSREEYDDALDQIRSYLCEGDTYQVNYSFRLRAPFSGNPYTLFHSLQRTQQAGHSAFIETDEFAIASMSPELFFELEDNRIRSRPMKGTAARGLTYEQDVQSGEFLQNSEKNRAENIMIVDMIRNDLGRIADAGSVHPVSLFDIERYPTVLQMTSTVEAEADAPIYDIVQAMFPCASVTGAPKIRTMQIIKELESSARGVYTGCVGMMGPGRKANFNVAIRTVTIDKTGGSAEYGVGGGIVWDSVNALEYDECVTKAAVLTRALPEFELLETLLWEPGNGFFLVEYHLDRLRKSAHYFGFEFDSRMVLDRLEELGASLTTHAHRVRLLLCRDGTVQLEHADAAVSGAPLRVDLAADPVDPKDSFLYHKTTHRAVYEDALNARPGVDDVILYNSRDQITEFTTANIVIERDGRRYTPPVECGLLAGTFRRYLLEKGEIEEAVITVDELDGADQVYLINSVRRWVEVEWV